MMLMVVVMTVVDDHHTGDVREIIVVGLHAFKRK